MQPAGLLGQGGLRLLEDLLEQRLLREIVDEAGGGGDVLSLDRAPGAARARRFASDATARGVQVVEDADQALGLGQEVERPFAEGEVLAAQPLARLLVRAHD